MVVPAPRYSSCIARRLKAPIWCNHLLAMRMISTLGHMSVDPRALGAVGGDQALQAVEPPVLMPGRQLVAT